MQWISPRLALIASMVQHIDFLWIGIIPEQHLWANTCVWMTFFPWALCTAAKVKDTAGDTIGIRTAIGYGHQSTAEVSSITTKPLLCLVLVPKVQRYEPKPLVSKESLINL